MYVCMCVTYRGRGISLKAFCIVVRGAYVRSAAFSAKRISAALLNSVCTARVFVLRVPCARFAPCSMLVGGASCLCFVCLCFVLVSV